MLDTWAFLPALMHFAAAPRCTVSIAGAPLALLGTWSLRRARRTHRHWDRRSPLLPLAAWALAVVVAPLPGHRAGALVTRLVTTMDADQGQSNALLLWGETACAHADLTAALGRVAALPTPLQATFMDGCAHSLRLDVTDPARTARSIEATAPPRWRPYLHEAALREVAARVGLDPEPLLAAVERYVSAVPGGIDPRNAVRTALQRDLGSDLARALATALRYPADWRPALVEELGWRAGDERSGAEVARLARPLPAPLRCTFVRGVIRGRMLRQTSGRPWTWSEIDAFRAPLPACPEDQAMGVAWALQISHSDDLQMSRAAARRIPDETLRAAVMNALETISTPLPDGRTPPIWR